MRNFLIVLFIYFLLALISFFKGHQGMIVSDANGWFHTYEQMGWHGLLYSFNDRSLHYFYHLFFFLCYKCFGFHTAYWSVFYCALHAMAAAAGFILFRKTYTAQQFEHASITAFIGGLLFVVNAYNAEPVLWAACIHYPLCVIFIMAALICMIEYAMSGKRREAFLFIICFISALFLLELSLALPLICIPLFFVFKKENFSRQKFLLLEGASVFIILIYLLLNKLKFGSVVGHYGSSVHLNTDVVLLSSNLNKYFAKYFLFSQFWDYKYVSKLYHIFETPGFAYGAVVFYAAILLLFVFFKRHLSNRVQTIFLMGVCSVMCLAPVINLFFTYIVRNEGDRLGYLFAMFFSHSLSLLVFSILPYGAFLLAIYFGLNFNFLQKNVTAWKNAGQVEEHLLKTFTFQNAPCVFILNLPDNYSGAYMFRSFDGASEMKDALQVRGMYTNRVVETLKYNMRTIGDSVKVQRLSDHELKITFAQEGNWWWRDGIGAANYKNDEYAINIDEWNFSYVIDFKKKIPGTVYLYQCGDNWRQVDNF